MEEKSVNIDKIDKSGENDESKQVKILVAKCHATKCIFAHVVPQKGVDDPQVPAVLFPEPLTPIDISERHGSTLTTSPSFSEVVWVSLCFLLRVFSFVFSPLCFLL